MMCAVSRQPITDDNTYFMIAMIHEQNVDLFYFS